MLRSAKLLPLCKSARNWIVAGTFYGPKATGDAGNSDDNRHEDSSSEAWGYHHHQHHHHNQHRAPEYAKELHTQSVESAKSSFAAARDATFRQNLSSRDGRSYPPELVPADGLASVGRYPATYKSSGARVVKNSSSSSSPTPSGGLKAAAAEEQELGPSCSSTGESDAKSSTFSKASCVESEDAASSRISPPDASVPSFEPPSAGVPVFGTVPPIDEFEKPVFSDLRRDSSFVSLESTKASVPTFSSSELPGFESAKAPDLTTFESAKSVPAFSAPDTSSSTLDTPTQVRPSSATSDLTEARPKPPVQHQSVATTSAAAASRSDSAPPFNSGSSTTTLLTSTTTSTSTTATTSTTAAPGYHRKNSGGRHHRGNRTNSGDSHRLVARVCGILNQHGWSDEAVRALAALNTNLSAYQVNEVLKQQRDAGVAHSFFVWAKSQAGFKHDVHTYTTMLGLLGRARSFATLNSLLDEMIREGCEPNVVTYNRLIHCYGRANDLEASLRLFDVMRAVGCEPDRVTYCTLIDLQAKAGFHDAAMELYRQMQLAGFRPDTFTYSIIIHCLGKAGKLNAAYKLFCEMTERGFAPSLVTYNIIIDLHAKAGRFDMALKLFADLQEVGYSPDRVTYGIIMEVLGSCGHVEDAERVFEEMERAGWAADNPIFGLMVDLWGKSGNAEKAAEWFNRMLDAGLAPNVPACNSLLSAYLRASFYDAAGGVLRGMAKWGLLPTLQTYTSLLSSCAVCRAAWEYDAHFALMSGTGHLAHPFVCSLLAGTNAAVCLPRGTESMPRGMPGVPPAVLEIRAFFDAMQFEELESRRGFADSLIDFLHRAGKAVAAGSVWDVAAEKNLYPNAVREKAPNYWSINLHVMSMGTALVVLSKTLAMFREAVLRTGAAPYRIDIITGWGRRSRVPGASLVKQAVEEMLRALNSPFRLDGLNVGCFVGQGQALMEWLKMPQLDHPHQALKFA